MEILLALDHGETGVEAVNPAHHRRQEMADDRVHSSKVIP